MEGVRLSVMMGKILLQILDNPQSTQIPNMIWSSQNIYLKILFFSLMRFRVFREDYIKEYQNFIITGKFN